MPPARKYAQKRSNFIALGGVLFLVLSLGVGLFLVSKPQILQEKAQTTGVQPALATITFPKAGKIRIYYYDYTHTTSTYNTLLFHLTRNGQIVSPQLPGGVSSTPMEYLDTDIAVNAGDTFTAVQAIFDSVPQPALGWIEPDANNCGAPGHVAGAAPQIAYATSFGEPLVSQQCWADYSPNPADPSTHDFNDFFVIFSYTPSAATPSPSPTPRLNSWDVDQNGIVNIVDIGLIIDNYAKNPALDPRTDVNADGVVDIVDIGIVIDHYSF